MVKKIAAGKEFIMQSKHVEETFLLLTQIRSSPGAFADLPCSISNAVEFYRAQEGNSTEKLFWSQYAGAELAIRGLIVRMWAGEPLPGSYFGLVKRLVNACPRLKVIKRYVCIEGARRAFARAKVQ